MQHTQEKTVIRSKHKFEKTGKKEQAKTIFQRYWLDNSKALKDTDSHSKNADELKARKKKMKCAPSERTPTSKKSEVRGVKAVRKEKVDAPQKG